MITTKTKTIDTLLDYVPGVAKQIKNILHKQPYDDARAFSDAFVFEINVISSNYDGTGPGLLNQGASIHSRATFEGFMVRKHIQDLADVLVSQDIIERYIPEGAEQEALDTVMSDYIEQITNYCAEVLNRRHGNGQQRLSPLVYQVPGLASVQLP